MFQTAPNWRSGCDSSRAQTPHSGIMNVTLGDASVRGVDDSIAPATWANVCHPADGLTVGDW
jgi:hypothetical protein